MGRGNAVRHYDTAIDRSVAGTRRFATAWLGLVLLTFNIFGAVPLAGASPNASAAVPFTPAFGDGHLVVCTAAGMVVIADGGVPSPDGENGGHGGFCFLCLPLFHATGWTPAATVAIVPPGRTAALRPVAPPYRLPLPPSLLTGAAGPRAPPRA